jgi:hypothetical protein
MLDTENFIDKCRWCNQEYNWSRVRISRNYVRGADPCYCSDKCRNLKKECFTYAQKKHDEALREFEKNNGYAFKYDFS